MWLSATHLFYYAWTYLVSLLGSTTVSICLFAFIIPALNALIIFISSVFERKTSGLPMKQIVRKSFLDKKTVVTAMVYILAWFLLISWSIGPAPIFCANRN